MSGAPNAGKTTLCLQIAERYKTLFVAGEQTVEGLKDYTNRCRINSKDISVWPLTNVLPVLGAEADWELEIYDSLHTLYCPDVGGAPGSVTQVTEVVRLIAERAHTVDVTALIIGHINKADEASGPMAAQHLVDGVLDLRLIHEDQPLRIFRVKKHRYGPSPIGTEMLMTDQGFSRLEALDQAGGVSA